MMESNMLLTAAILLLAMHVFLGFKRPGTALIASAITAVMVSVTGYAERSIVIVVFAPVIFLATLITVLVSKYKYDHAEWPKEWAAYLIKSLAFGVLGLLLISSRFPFSFGFLALLVSALAAYSLVSFDTTTAYVISTIGSSIRQNLPLTMALESAASGQNDKNSRILRKIQKWLLQGYSLSESIKRGYPKCPGHVVAIIAAAERIDQLPFAIKSIEADMLAKADSRKKIGPVNPAYSITMLFFITSVILGFVTFVLPKVLNMLTEVYENFELPAATRFLKRLYELFAHKIGWSVWLVFLSVILVVALVSSRVAFRSRRPQHPYLVSRIGDFVKWHLPILNWFENNYSMVQVVELLRLSLNSGCTVNKAIANTLDLDVNICFKKRLCRWLAKVEAGENMADAARKSGLGSTLAWAFDEKINHGDTLAVLEILESFYRSNYSCRVNLLRFILWPGLTIVTGMMVGFIAYAMFSPMVLLVKHLVASVVP
jgi:type II secretory pathway component PulF